MGLECGCTWDDEHGLGILLHKNRVVEIGSADVPFSSSASYKDNDTYEAIQQKWEAQRKGNFEWPKPKSLDTRISIAQKLKIGYTDSSLALIDQTAKLILDTGTTSPFPIFNNKPFNIFTIKSILIKGTIPKIDKIRVFNSHHIQFENKDFDEILTSIGEPYSYIAQSGKRPQLENNETNKAFVEILSQKGYISKFTIEEKGIRVFTFKN